MASPGIGGQIEHMLGAHLARAASAACVLADQVDATQTPAVHLIVEALEHAEGMLRDVAELLRNDDSCAPAPPRRMNFTRLCERVLDSIQCRYPIPALKLESDRRVEGSGDPDAIAAMISRIVVNAIQHGTRGASVRVKVWGFDERAIVEVWNAGAFPDEVAAAPFFEAFACARPRRSDGGRGLGLGLYLASRTARAHGGRIEVQSDARNGTTVRIVLPRS